MEKYIKKFEQVSDESNRIKLLEEEIIKRDELIYSMMRNLSHGYMNFMADKTIDIDEMRRRFKTEEVVNRPLVRERIDLLHKDIIG